MLLRGQRVDSRSGQTRRRQVQGWSEGKLTRVQYRYPYPPPTAQGGDLSIAVS